MPPVQTFTESPINASKADGTTPQTKAPDNVNATHAPPTTTLSSPQSRPPPQPGAVPSQPIATASASQPQSNYLPTPTQQVLQSGPPPPQPGAVPVPPTAQSSSYPPPPPKAGEPMPPQLTYTAPSQTYPGKAGSSTISAPPHAQIPGPAPTYLQDINQQSGASTSHPPGYRQDDQAAEFSSAQRAAHNASVEWDGQNGGGGDEEGIWNTAKKWATAAGENLAAAENEMWKRINKE